MADKETEKTVGREIVDAYCEAMFPGASEQLRVKFARRADAFLNKSYDKINLGRSHPPGLMYKIGAMSGLAPFFSYKPGDSEDDG